MGREKAGEDGNQERNTTEDFELAMREGEEAGNVHPAPVRDRHHAQLPAGHRKREKNLRGDTSRDATNWKSSTSISSRPWPRKGRSWPPPPWSKNFPAFAQIHRRHVQDGKNPAGSGCCDPQRDKSLSPSVRTNMDKQPGTSGRNRGTSHPPGGGRGGALAPSAAAKWTRWSFLPERGRRCSPWKGPTSPTAFWWRR